MINRRLTAMPVSAALLAGLVLSGCGAKTADTTAASKPSSPPATTSAATASPAGDKVAPADLAAIVSDRTFRGDDGGNPYAEYYAPDGSLRGKSDGEAYTGSWKVVGEQLCFTYRNSGPAAGSAEETDCYTVFRDGDKISWVDPQGKVTQATFVQGNPDNL